MKTITKFILLSAMTAFCACGKTETTPEPAPKPEVKPAEVVAGTYDCYFEEGISSLIIVSKFTDAGSVTITATGDDTATAVFKGPGFFGGLTENMEITESVNGYTLSCVDKNMFSYGSYMANNKSIIFYVERGIGEPIRILRAGTKMPTIFKYSGAYSCTVDEKKDWNVIDFNTVTNDNTLDLYLGYIEAEGNHTAHYLHIENIPCTDDGVLSGTGLGTTFKPKSEGDETTASVTGTFSKPGSFNISIVLKDGTTYTVH